MDDVETIDHGNRDGTRNMYGCTPCPKCGEPYRYGRHRWSLSRTYEMTVRCDDCNAWWPAVEITEDQDG